MRPVTALLAAAALLLAAPAANAGFALYIHDSANRLGTVDVGTGAVTVLGSLGGDLITDIAFDPAGNLYGVSFTRLYRIDAATAAVTLVGTTGQTGLNALVFGADGTLYSAAFDTTQLYRLNTATGAATGIGNLGIASAGDLAFVGGDLFMSTTSSPDPTSFVPSNLLRIGLSGGGVGSVTTVGSLNRFNVYGLARADDGVLYGVSGATIFSVNPATAATTTVRFYGGRGLGVAFGTAFFAEAGATPVPAPPAAALALVGGLTAHGCARRRVAL